MAQVILYNHNYNGTPNVVLCIPTGELTIEEVLAKDVPQDATNVKIVDNSIIPQEYFNYHTAWNWDGTNLTIDMSVAKTMANTYLNTIAKTEAQHRMTNTLSGIPNALSDDQWLALLTTARTAISNGTTLAELNAASVPVSEAITNNSGN